ncbi:MAG TPA: hypothetical protein VF752_17065 [Thermoleophilaceae bacterium]
MYASIRSYRINDSQVDDLMHRIDTEFADSVQDQPGFISYQAVYTGGGTLCTVTVCRDEATCDRTNEMAAMFVRESLSDMEIERTDVKGGEVMVSRAASEVLQLVHH